MSAIVCTTLPACRMYPTPHTHDPHIEGHFESSATVRDIVIGLSDGLTVPFALAAGLSGAVASSHIVVLAGLAEIAAGSIAMGLGGYLAARGDAEHYVSEQSTRRARDHRAHARRRRRDLRDLRAVLRSIAPAPLLSCMRSKQNPTAWVDFMMRFELGLEEPASNRAHRSALTIAASYIAGGLIPLLPYMLVRRRIYTLHCLNSRSSSRCWPWPSSAPLREDLWGLAGSAALSKRSHWRSCRRGRLPLARLLNSHPTKTQSRMSAGLRPSPAILRKVFQLIGFRSGLRICWAQEGSG